MLKARLYIPQDLRFAHKVKLKPRSTPHLEKLSGAPPNGLKIRKLPEYTPKCNNFAEITQMLPQFSSY